MADDRARRRAGARRGRAARARALTFQPGGASRKSAPMMSMRSVQIASTPHCASRRARAGSFTV
ncbi:hypothetical protein LY284_14610 [Caballeronia sp. PC1]|nr:hypothetical protein [Caballeronia sp. PC1]